MSMILIREIVKQTLTSGYLSTRAEDQLRQLLADKYDQADLNAFMALQLAVVKGRVKQESREMLGDTQR
jgi:hypothetical protein